MTRARPAFARANRMPHVVIIPVGDWSQDGHNMCKNVTFFSSRPAEELRAAYNASVAKTGLTFDHQHKGEQICTDYGDAALKPVVQKKLAALGYDLSRIEDTDCVQPAELADMVMWFAGLSIDDFEYTAKGRPRQKDGRVLNGYWNKELNVQFGYGLFER
jgi:hypothetical protein